MQRRKIKKSKIRPAIRPINKSNKKQGMNLGTKQGMALSIGATIDATNPNNLTLVNKTGSWRTLKPIRDNKKCTKCMLCWMYCPDNSISEELEFDYDYCKGCGICAEICPIKAITMQKEEK